MARGTSIRERSALVIVAKDGVARIIDFGLAKSTGATGTQDGATKGTPLYMSPEQASGKPLDCRTDLWSLGAVLYEMLAGRPPFTGDTNLSIMHAIVHDASFARTCPRRSIGSFRDGAPRASRFFDCRNAAQRNLGPCGLTIPFAVGTDVQSSR
jgi:serine/threonine protein kinase